LVDHQYFDLYPVVKDFLEDYLSQIPTEIQVNQNLEKGNYFLYGSSLQLQKCLRNILENAVQALEKAEKKQILITLKKVFMTTLEGDPKCSAKIEIQDTGEGMEPEVVGRIFEPYFSTKPPNKASGMGLAQVYGIVEDMGGKITVETEPGKGSTFTLFIPLLDKSNGNKDKILVVDNDPSVLHVLCRLLEKLNYNFILAQTGEEALEIFQKRESEIGLVLTDNNMPGMEGTLLAEKLMEISPTVKVILLSGHLEELEIKPPVLELLKKPVILEKLQRVLQKWLPKEQES
ncbi:MAG: response regulator, partial [Planctomycetota bacterium]